KKIAKKQGTYFATQVEFDNWVIANGGDVPGGQIIYTDFDDWIDVQFGPNYNADASIIIHSNATGTAAMKNLHGQFKGLVLSDRIEHINGDVRILGMVMSWAQAGNAYGNGNARVRFSSAVLASLPGTSQTNLFIVLSWREP
ncbi:MAG: hypothetical protein ACYTAF_11895, partial [Planctomycetota bacterium]